MLTGEAGFARVLLLSHLEMTAVTMTNSSAKGPLSKQHGAQALLFIHHRRFFHVQPFLLHQLPPFFLDAN